MKLEEYLIRNALTDEDFARKIGISKHAVRKYKSGAREVPRKWIVLEIEKKTKGEVAPIDWYR